MDISIATARPATQQANSVKSLVPMHLREGAENFISFLEDYYSHINTDGLPTQEISNIMSEHDIDRTSSQYIDLIQGEIAKNVPNAVAFDRVSLYKKIVEYYKTKGSGDSIINFFKIFYDESIELKYPRERLFKTSSGTWDQESERYRNTKGFSSDSDVLQDSNFWQDFSYVIETAVPVSEWKNEFLGLVHPAGFKFFGVLVLLLVRRKKWIGRFIKYNSETKAYEYDNLPANHHTPYKTHYTEDLDWMKSLTQPSRSTQDGYGDQYGDHTPMFQYGLLGRYLVQNLCVIANATDDDFVRLVIRTLHLWSVADCDHYAVTRNDYLNNLKFLDSDTIGEYSDTMIMYGDTYPCHDVSKPVIDILEANVPMGQTMADYECLNSELDDDDLVDENGDCINATFTGGFDAHRELDPQVSEALGQISNEIRVIDKVNRSSIFVTRDGGNLYDNYLNRKVFSNISSFVNVERTTCLSGTMTIGGEPSYDSIVTDDGDNICMYFDYDEHKKGLLELYPGAAAAYSLRLLNDIWKDLPVIEVRRASDDAVAGFTADQVAGIAPDTYTVSGAGTSAVNGTYVRNGTSSDGRPVYILYDDDGVTELYYIHSVGSISWILTDEGVDVASTSLYSIYAGSTTVPLTGQWIVDTGAADAPIVSTNRLPLTDWVEFGAGGFVTKWYDQSGKGNTAIQTDPAKQPMIVDAISELTDGIQFDGGDTLDLTTDIIASTNNVTSFLVSQTNDISSSTIPLALSRNSPDAARYYLGAVNAGNFYLGYGTDAYEINLGTADTSAHLFSATSNNTATEAFIDAVSKGTTSSVNAFSSLSSGGIGSMNGFNVYSGAISEIIIYDSDQGGNRIAIETNINDHYDIFNI